MQRLQTFGSRARKAGFTLIEVMIAMLIGVIGIVVMMQTFSVSEGFKRTATSGTDAQINGAVALYMLEREIRLAGYGMNDLVPAGCQTIRVYNQSSGITTNMRMVPFEINPPGIGAGIPDPNTDVLLIAYGNSDSFVRGVPADQTTVSTAPFRVTINRDGFRAGDIVVAMQPGAGPGGTNSCVMHELTWVPGGSGNCGAAGGGPTDLIHATAQYKHPGQNCQFVTPQRNSATGITESNGTAVGVVKASTGGMLFNMGGVPQVKVYAVINGDLSQCDWIAADCNNRANYQVVVNGIVSMRAVYGQDYDGVASPTTAAGDLVVDRWSRAAITTSNQASRVLAVSLGIAARSSLPEKPSDGGTACDTTTNAARPDKTQDWFGPTITPNDGTLGGAAMNLATIPGMPDATAWRCYRYKLFQTSVPIRNMIWRP